MTCNLEDCCTSAVLPRQIGSFLRRYTKGKTLPKNLSRAGLVKLVFYFSNIHAIRRFLVLRALIVERIYKAPDHKEPRTRV